MQPQTFRDLMRLVHGFEPAKILLVANDLDLFNQFDEASCPADELARRLQVDARALQLLLNALVAMGLLVKQGDRYGNADVAREFLAGDRYRGHIFRHIHHCWESWNDLAGVLKRGGPDLVREKAILHDEAEWNRDFIRGMDDVTRELAPQVVAQLDLGEARRLLDLGGGPGTYARAFLAAHQQLEQVTILDLPQTLNVARESLTGYERADDVVLVEGDFHECDLGSGFDAVWISQVFHSVDEEGCQMLINKAWQALNPGGRLLVHEFLLDDDRTGPLSAALFAVHMLVMTAGGRTYSGAEIGGWMQQCGFSAVEVKRVSDETRVVIGSK
ncbi:MAG: methyltransferase [Desulfuromonadales bacterium]|nr:methyltransferase [Desulfuromonadales bacterium]